VHKNAVAGPLQRRPLQTCPHARIQGGSFETGAHIGLHLFVKLPIFSCR